MRKITLLTCIFIFTLCCNNLSADENTLKIGSISILTGEGSSFGVAAKNGLSMAVEDLNSKGGVLGKQISVDYQDDQGDPKNTISAFRQLTEISDIKFIIGPSFSRCAIPLIKLAENKKVIMISPSAGMAEFNESSKFLFNTWPHDYITSQKLADYVFSKGHRKVALVGAEEPWVKEQSKYFKGTFEKLGGQIAYLVEPLPGTTDLNTIALKISKTPGVDAFVSTTDGVIIGSLVAKALKQISFNIPKYSVTIDQAAIDASVGGFEGLEFPSSLTPSADFKARYESKFKVNIEIGADSAYDAMMMVARAISESNSLDTTRVAQELAKIKSYQGASGTLVSDGKRGFTKGFVMKKVMNGKQVDIG
jgi:branched-chain amino acid transport system substrate-binding protein